MSRGLGKGLGAFFADADIKDDDKVIEVSLSELRPNPYQPRKQFDQEAIQELKESILQHGIIQPLIVRKSIRGYEIVAGERRFRASKEAGLQTVPVVIKEFTEDEMREIALIENLQRENLNAIEEAEAYQAIMDASGLTQEELAKRLGKSRPYIANHLRLINLPAAVKALLSDKTLSMGHGRALLGLKDRKKIVPVTEKAIKERLNVRQLEELVKKINENVSRETKKKTKEDKSIFIKETESYLREQFGTPVLISKSKKKGKIEIEFYSEDDLERIIELLQRG
ncbi:chromosome partitioning protein ParB [Lottiidibacillus patelloidae]|uniref:Chromosome partitioning protein ParB n=1 Tax=Lottiidibacillus patelloidae TaxID=2670334 RepID=A0A263BS81_9BACI|nr:ParB/RepB/Spo0J family partition protein [Lottiidibacillus patelloidae]OZM56573.1 chromosome partitioning protein ParB [Lottiidibacillus patelloidae]